MIIKSSDDTSINGTKLTSTNKFTDEWYGDVKRSIIFNKSDANDLTFPHNDALVITLRILDTDVRRIIVDDRSETCIIQP